MTQRVMICLQCRRPRFHPWVQKIPWRKEQLTTPVFWSGEFHGLYSTWGWKELDTAEWLSLSYLKLTCGVLSCLVVSNSLGPHGLCGLSGFSVHKISQARILEWFAISYSRVSSWPRDQIQISCIAGRFFTVWATKEPCYPVLTRGQNRCSAICSLKNSKTSRKINHVQYCNRKIITFIF